MYRIPLLLPFKWRYVKDSSGNDGDDCGWVDPRLRGDKLAPAEAGVQWTGASPAPDSDNWQQIDFKYDVYGRRSEKIIDGYPTRYLYDGPHVIAEYDGNNNLLRKYIYGPGIDQPISMIEVADSNATYYYHYDALGSVIALSDSSGDTVQTYEYSVFGEVAVEDANHTNPYMFAGRRFDAEIGLYYNRARYYNPYTGRFLQTDPIGYGAGMNVYTYCWNNSLMFTDPMGLRPTLDLGVFDSCDIWDFCDVCDYSFDWNDDLTLEALDHILGDNDMDTIMDIVSSSCTEEPEQAVYKPGKSPPTSWPYPGKGWRWNPEGYYEKHGKRKHYHPKDPGHRPHWDLEDGKGNKIGKEYEVSLPSSVWNAITGAASAVASAASSAASAAYNNPAMPYIAAGVLIGGDIVLGGPTGEGIAPALIIIKNGTL